jgi:hypothetical protein
LDKNKVYAKLTEDQRKKRKELQKITAKENYPDDY